MQFWINDTAWKTQWTESKADQDKNEHTKRGD